MTRHALLKRALGRAVAAPTLEVLRRTSLRAGLSVYYHRVGDPQGDPRRELVPQMGTALFAGQVRYSAAHFRLVRASELPEAVATRGPADRFPLAITFDDDLACHRATSMAILAASDAPGTFFVSGASLSTPAWFWWEVLDAHDPDPHLAAERLFAMTHSDRASATTALVAEAPLPPPHAGMRGDDVAALVQAGHEIGFHTLRHHLLPDLDDASLASAMSDGREEIEAWAGGRLSSIAYPHGRADRRVADAARRAGFAVGFTSAETAATPDADPLAIGRLEGPFSSVGHLAFVLARTLLRAYRS